MNKYNLPIYVTQKFQSAKLSENTCISYSKSLNNYMKNKWDDKLLFNIELIETYLTTLSLQTKSIFLHALYHGIEGCYMNHTSKLKRLLNECRGDSTISLIRGLKTSNKEKIKYEDVLYLADKKQKNIINDLIAKLYSLEVPLRADTWSLVRVLPVDEISEDYNYLDLDSGELILNQYKTVNTYGKKSIFLSKSLLEYINKWWKDNIIQIGNIYRYLVPSRDGNRLSPHNFNLRLQTIFNDSGSRDLRHSYISYKKRMGVTDLELREISYRMNTSYLMANVVYDDTHHIIQE